MTLEEAEALAAKLMAGKEPGGEEWDSAMKVLLQAMRERVDERPCYQRPVQRSIAA